MSNKKQQSNTVEPCESIAEVLLKGRPLIVVSNRGPVGFSMDEDNKVQIQRSGGGLVTALRGLAQNVNNAI
ncbi:MAG: hypothetical protein ACD_34C00408G0002 [uncultured bacterium]|nr:MAG: hypothetical protein ACD_34C00408G0002 [uncultured bacterium]HCS38133.1 hypothetical protein [Anaerolineaceae bacterium]